MHSKVAIAAALSCALAYAPPVSAKHYPDAPSVDAEAAMEEPLKAKGEESQHTITWWCVDLNDLYHVDVPVVAGRGLLEAPADPPVPTCSETSFPQTVPSDSGFTVQAAWFTNKTYPDWIRDALVASGYNFVDASPIEDLMKKIVEVHIRVGPFRAPFTDFTFDPRKVFRRYEYRRHSGALLEWEFANRKDHDQLVAAGITSAAELGRLPTVSFPGIAGPLPPGQYRAFVIVRLSEPHNDGLGLGPGSFLPAGDSPLANVIFVVQ